MVSPSGIWHQTSSSRVSFYWKDEQKNTHDNTLQYPVSWFEVSYIPIQSNLGIAVKSSQFKEGVIGMNILNLSVTYLTTSVTRLFCQDLAIYNNNNLPKRKQNVPKGIHNIAKYQINL